ncbi:MAG: leucine-rich repeat protein, partial [Bacteroidaceae bacterium]|nr:leucine-rich repeat protein [Bacteroidaceae bacterium]
LGGTYYTPLFNMSNTSSYTLYLGRTLSTEGDGCYFPYATSVTIGDKVTAINSQLFYKAAKLGSVTIGSGVTSIGANAFENTGTDESVTNQTISMGSSVTTIGNSAFQGCSKLTEITLPDVLTVIPEYAFGNTGLTSITIPASVASVGSCAFQLCNSLTSITIEDSATPLQWLGGTYYTPLFNMSNTSSYTLYLGRTLSTEGDGCYFPYATSVTIGNKVTAINSKLFQGATKLASVTLGSGVTSMGTYAFDGCTTLASIDLSVATGLTEIPERAFNNCDALTAFNIPANIQTIESSAFYNMNADITVTIEDGETPLTLNCAYSYYPIFESNNTVTAYVGRNIVRTGYYANQPTFNGSLVGLTFGPKVTAIGDYEYKDRTVLAGAVNGLSNVVSIGAKAFNNCPNITSIEIGNKLATLGEYAFQDCQKLESISLPGTLKKIPTEAFENCFALATVTLAEGIEEIGNGAFYDTDALTEITIPASVKKIGRAPFYCNSNQAMTRMIIADSDTPLEFANVTSEYNYGYDYITDNIALDYFYLGRDITRAKTDQSLVYSATNIEIGPKVTNIDKLFDHTSDVQSVKVHALTPIAISTDPFDSNTYANATLWVPGGTKAAYQAADYWKNFGNIETWSFVLNYTVNGHGTMDIDGEAAGNGETKTVRKPNGDGLANSNWTWTVTPDAGYELTSLTVEDKTEATDPAVQEIFVGNAGWENPHTEGTAINHDLDYVATFAPITYAITYDLAGGTLATANPATYNVESAAFTLTNPTREGYTFAGWTGTDLTAATTTVTIAKGSIGDRSYVATWTPITYNVTYDLAGGAVATDNPATYNIETAAFTLTNPTRTGYTFAGWIGTDLGAATATVTVAQGSMGNRSYTATWTPVTYTITYDLAGGTVSTANPTSYNIETAAFTLNNPTREHYLFAGWTGTELASATEVVTVATGSTGNRSFTATWTEATYAVSISGAGVTASNNSPKYGESVTITIADDPDRTLSALTINGTDVTSSVSGGKYTIASVSGDVSVVATFASTKEFITVSSLGIKTYCCAQDLDFTGSDLRAYIAAGYNKATNTVLLVRVYDVPAGTGIIVKGDEGTYKIPYATTQAYYVNMLVGVVGAGTVYKTTGTMSNYVLNNGGDGIGFYTPVDAGATLNNGAYLQVPTALTAGSSKVRYMFEDEGTATDIAGFEMYDQRSNEGIYNMSGQKLDGVQRGLNIVNGKKVLVK